MVRKTILILVSLVMLGAACTKNTPKAAAPKPSESPSVSPSPGPSPTPSPTKTPEVKGPLSEARVEGKFKGGGIVGLSSIDIEPTCKKGACRKIVGTGGRGTTLAFKRKGKTYVAKVTDHDTCGNASLGFQLTFHFTGKLKVTKGADIDGEWRATQLEMSSTLTSSGGSTSRTTGLTTRTVTCRPIHERDHGKMFLQGNFG